MASFLTTNGVSHHLEELVKGADRRVYLISPYIKLNDRLRDLLDHRVNRGLRVRLLYGKERKLKADVRDWLDARPGVSVRFRPNLHGKCYVSETEAVVTSMNLYEYSQQNNDEFGVRLTLSDDPAAFRDLVAEINRVWAAAEPPPGAAAPATGDEPAVEPVVLFESSSSAGSEPSPDRSAAAAAPAGDRISTSQLAKRNGVSSKEMFRRLAFAGLIDGSETRGLTPAGVAAGGTLKSSARYGDYVVWPPDLTVRG